VKNKEDSEKMMEQTSLGGVFRAINQSFLVGITPLCKLRVEKLIVPAATHQILASFST
jgi:hypothetical protein